MKYLITGCAGFIGAALSERLLAQGVQVIGVDNLNDYYDVELKYARLARLQKYPQFQFNQFNLAEMTQLNLLFRQHQNSPPSSTQLSTHLPFSSFDCVIHLAAQAGVRYSLDAPLTYGESNLTGFLNVLECCRQAKIKHLLYASSSSVYGANQQLPFQSSAKTEQPLSLYAATKKANELMAYSYSHLYQLPTTGLRFFTVYGPWGRPDMALFKFTQAMLNGEPLPLYNQGQVARDFTYIDDIVDAIVALIDKPKSTSATPYQVFNLGRGESIPLMRFVKALEAKLGCIALKNLLPMQEGDMLQTWAETQTLTDYIGCQPKVSIEQGVAQFVDWYLSYYHHQSIPQQVLA